MWWVSPGILLGGTSTGSFDVQAEISAFGDFSRLPMLGLAAGSSIHVHSLELEVAAPIGGELHGVMLGLNPGVVWNREMSQGVGFQGTFWVWPMIQCGHACFLPLPIPYFRLRLFGAGDDSWIAGLAVKLPWPVAGL